jgi:hypothetical protein
MFYGEVGGSGISGGGRGWGWGWGWGTREEGSWIRMRGRRWGIRLRGIFSMGSGISCW